MSNGNNHTGGNIKKVAVIAVFVLLLLVTVYFYLSAPGEQSQSDNQSSQSTSSSADVESGDIAEDSQGSQSIQSAQSSQQPQDSQTESLRFRNSELLEQHYQKHGIEMGFSSPEEYQAAAAAVAASPNALHKTEKEDGDDVYYIEETNEFVVVSTDGYIRTYFYPSAGRQYFDRQ